MRVIPSIVFSLIAYFMTGLQRSAGQFFVFLITIFMASVFGSAICFFVSAAIPVFGKSIYNVQQLNVNSSVSSKKSFDFMNNFDLSFSCGSNRCCTHFCRNVCIQWFSN
jgi:hypothetical protein